MTARRFFHTHLEGPILVLEIRQPVGSLADVVVMAELNQVLDELRQSRCREVLVDFCKTAYFGSSLLEALRNIWLQVHGQQGRMVLCNLSPVGREILEVAKFDHLWPIIEDRAAALSTLQAST